MCPLRSGYSPTAVVPAASDIADDGIVQRPGGVTAVHSITQTAGVRRRGKSLHRQWKKASSECKQQ
jgi:hypothetical protein